MNESAIKQPATVNQIRIFITYSTKDSDWVTSLANRLEAEDNFHVIWDQYDIDNRDDHYKYMDDSIMGADYILVICTPDYKKRADDQLGGVGYETQILKPYNHKQITQNQKSNLIPLEVTPDCLPIYLTGRNPISFIRDDDFEKSYQNLVKTLNDNAKTTRPQKFYLDSINKRTYTFTKAEDVIAMNNKNRKALLTREESTNIGGNTKLDIELWETATPALNYILVIHKNTKISDAVKKTSSVFTQNNINPSEITVLRLKDAKRSEMAQLFSGNGFDLVVHDFSFARYIWEYCIDPNLKENTQPTRVPHYIDQALVVSENGSANTLDKPAIAYLTDEVYSEDSAAGHFIVATGGMGKTSLCSSLHKNIIENSDLNPVTVILISAELLKPYFLEAGNVRIESVYDLYRAYINVKGIPYQYNQTDFDLAVVCGKLVIIIDGVDELVALLQQKFDFDNVLESIGNLHKELGSSNFILTSRSALVVEDRKLEELNIRKYSLLGFSENDLKSYAGKRFRKFQNTETISSKFFEIFEKMPITDNSNRIIPFVVDVVATILEQDFKDTNSSKFKLSFEDTEYRSNNELVDCVINSIVKREIKRQSYSIATCEIVDHVSEWAVNHHEHIPLQSIEETMQMHYGENSKELVAKLILNPIFIEEANYLAFRYDFLKDYFSAIYLINSISEKRRSHKFYQELSRHTFTNESDDDDVDYSKEVLDENRSIVVRQLTSYFRKNKAIFEESLVPILEHLKTLTQSEDHPADVIEHAKRSIYALLDLHATINNLSGTKLAKEIERLFLSDKTKHIENLYIYGKFKKINFSNLKFTSCGFIHYKSFQYCTFANTEFFHCTFRNCKDKAYPGRTFAEAYFDTTCILDDLQILITLAKADPQELDMHIELELTNFLKSFRQEDRLSNKKVQELALASHLQFIDFTGLMRLVKKGIINLKTDSDESSVYSISSKYIQSVNRFIDTGMVDAKIKEIKKTIKA